MKCAYSSNVGMRRRTNQDAYLAANFEKDGKTCYVFAVADGLGGHPAGEVASQLAVEYIKQNISAMDNLGDYGCISDFVNDINREILRQGEEIPEQQGMATTLTMCIVVGDRLGIAHVGDSRAYRITEKGMDRLTKDHSLVQILVDEGRLKSSQAEVHPQKNVITRALGTDLAVKVDYYEYSMLPGEYYLVCSDGLYNMVSESHISEVIRNYKIEEAVKLLVDTANVNGGNDNITVILFYEDPVRLEQAAQEKQRK